VLKLAVPISWATRSTIWTYTASVRQ